ncbi:MAG: alpha-mannosidase [Actinobacteria bacterium]|nr:alpha-mannosidase [Actinomycetota bacterium]
MRTWVVVLVVAACLGVTAAAWAHPGGGTGSREQPPAAETAIFYYPWFGTETRDGAFTHWQQGGHAPPAQIASGFYPARGPYSSADALVLAAQMREIAAAGISTVIVSWWGRGSLEDQRLPRVLAAAKLHGLAVAAHVEPYGGRTVESVSVDIAQLRSLGIVDFYIWASVGLPDADWARLNAEVSGVRLFANTNLAGKAAAGGFDGVYTYDVLLFDGSLFPRLCTQARRLRLLCAPSVGPGYDARRATGDVRLRPRRNGSTYDSMWRGAIRARADVVTVTSYNEWHEGTQIEPARAGKRGYESYDGAWGLRGAAAETSYLERTAHWTARFAYVRAHAR